MSSVRSVLWILIGLSLVYVIWRRWKRGQLMVVIWLILGIAAAVYIGLGLTLFVAQSRMLYQPTRDVAYTPKDAGLEYESVQLKTPDGETIAGWYIPAAAEESRRTVLFCHGNAGNISHRLYTLQLIHELGLNCLIVDYRGYGESTGKPTEKGTLTDIRTAWDWLINEKQKTPDDIIIFGRSLGGSIAAITAVEVRPAAVIIEIAFTSVTDVGRHYYPFLPVRWFVRFKYNTLAAVKQLNCPVLIVHSPDDEMIPYKFGRALFEAANEPKLFIELKGTHNEGFYDNGQLYRQIWQDWLDYLEVSNEPDDNRLDAAVP